MSFFRAAPTVEGEFNRLTQEVADAVHFVWVRSAAKGAMAEGQVGQQLSLGADTDPSGVRLVVGTFLSGISQPLHFFSLLSLSELWFVCETVAHGVRHPSPTS
jgi:hypothetical protein